MADPRSFADLDSAASRYTLIDHWHGDIFVSVVVVLYYDHLANQNISLQVDSVFGGYDTAKTYGAIVIKHNCRLAFWVIGGNIEPRVLFQVY